MWTRRDFLLSSAALSMAAAPAVLASHHAFLAGSSAAQIPLSPEVRTPSAASQASVLSSIDELTRKFLLGAQVSAAQLAVARKGQLLFSQFYPTRPPAGFARLNSQSLFRIADCSKLITCAAIDKLQKQHKLEMSQRVFPALGIHSPAIPRETPDPRIDEITVRHLIDHAGGWNDHESVTARDGTHIPGTGWEPVFGIRRIALDLGLAVPPTKSEIARYMYGKPLQFAPGSQDFVTTQGKSYSNFGYLLLGLLIESVAGVPYIEFVRTRLGPESDTSNIYLSRLFSGPRHEREVWYVDPGVGLTAIAPRSNAMLPSPYGAGFLPELMDSAGGLMTNAETLARFVARHTVWGMGDRHPGAERTGSLPGSSSFTGSRPNGVDCAFVLNTRTFRGGPKALEEFTSSLKSHLDLL